MRAKIKRVAILVLGWMFILLGIAGLFLPILQGILFLVVGLILLAKESETAHRLLQRLRKSHPQVDRVYGAAEKKAEAWAAKLRRRRAG